MFDEAMSLKLKPEQLQHGFVFAYMWSYKLSRVFYGLYDEGKVHACTNSVYQALFPLPPQEPGNQAKVIAIQKTWPK